MNRAIALTGTPVVPIAARTLRAGSLEATFDAGALRWVRWNGVEILRGILFLVRTPGWGTPPATLSSLTINQTDKSFAVAYEAHFGNAGSGVTAAIRFTGEADGTLQAQTRIRAQTLFATNRSGFVILHPLDGFAGTEVTVEHASAPARQLTIPLQISPGQPVLDMAAITHRPVRGLEVETRFEGDIFEMEDHRNWSDASFKTYSRPIGLPYPYTLDPGAPIDQAVTVTVRDTGAAGSPSPAIMPPAIVRQRMPHFVLPLDTSQAARDALRYPDVMAALAPASFLLRVDLANDAGAADFAPLAGLVKATGADLDIQVVLAAADKAGMEDELSFLATRLAAAGVTPLRVSAFPKIDEQSFQPGETRPLHPAGADIASSLARHFPNAARIGGTPAFFTEFNRKRPDPVLWDGLTFATTPVVHAADDASVMETLQSLPHILTAATALAGGLPLAIGPTGIGMRLNPYGVAPAMNAPDARTEMAARDPRQRGLMAAAWTVGYLARIAPYGPERFAFGAPTGPFGLVSGAQDSTGAIQDGTPDGTLFALFHVARWIVSAGGAPLRRVETHRDTSLVVWDVNGQRRALVVNLTPNLAPTPDTGLTAPRAVILDAETLIDLSQSATPDAQATVPPMLDAYAVLYLEEAVS